MLVVQNVKYAVFFFLQKIPESIPEVLYQFYFFPLLFGNACCTIFSGVGKQ